MQKVFRFIQTNLKEGIFVRPFIHKIIYDTEFKSSTTTKKKETCVNFVDAVGKFLGIYKNPSYK